MAFWAIGNSTGYEICAVIHLLVAEDMKVAKIDQEMKCIENAQVLEWKLNANSILNFNITVLNKLVAMFLSFLVNDYVIRYTKHAE
ncbi:hypothetical protein TNCT_667901 [Trichonephila clavata]|uniref:Uncharacterized protein n=1 Tax=Trichonephila clavata TaxID=2740835 RepID=A0A8X6LAZ3_TRICU|nr:hypothetical protein TNCT_667901 [Trichonephila clavata]